MKRTQTIGGIMMAFVLAGQGAALAGGPIVTAKNVVVVKKDIRYGGWPANHGIWSWGDEIVVGFTWGYLKLGPAHPVDPSKPAESVLARSLDGGKTWKIEKPKAFKTLGSPKDCPGGIDFTHKDFAMTLRGKSFLVSYDRGRTWKGAYKLPDFPGIKKLETRTDYFVEGKRKCTAFITAAKSNGKEGRPFCARTIDGGKTWQFVGWMTPEYRGKGYAIMPSSVRVSDTRIVSAIRRGTSGYFCELFASDDNGATWKSVIKNLTHGRTGDPYCVPPHMIPLKDGRLCLVYGYRSKVGSGVRARLSSDNGVTWSDEIILRDDGGNWDLGYPRSVQRPDGKIVTVYYFNEDASKARYIAATIWTPPAGKGIHGRKAAKTPVRKPAKTHDR